MFTKKKSEAKEEDKLWYRGQSGPLGRSAGRVSQLQGENGGRGRNGGRKSSILNWQEIFGYDRKAMGKLCIR